MSETLLETEPQKAAKPEGLPDKFWNAEEGAIRTDALLKSYLALEQKLSKKETPREEPPESADAYNIVLPSEMLKNDPEINARLHAKGFTNAQVQEVYDLASEKLVPMIVDIMNDVQADRELERIVDHFGGPEAWARVSRQLLAFGRKNLPDAILQTLASSYEGILTLHKMMTEKMALPRKDAPGKAKGAALDDGELAKMMKDPRYWRDRDPAFIAKVSEGFQNLYN